MTMIGLDPGELHTATTALRDAAESLEIRLRRLTDALTHCAWYGPDSDDLRDSWERGPVARSADIIRLLRELVEHGVVETAEQENASAA